MVENGSNVRTHHIIRVNDGENLRNSVNPYWGVTREAGQKSKVEKMNYGDVLWFLTSKPYGGKLIGMAEFARCSDRKDDPEFKGCLEANAEQGWAGNKEWDILIHYNDFHDVKEHNIGGCIQCVGNILPYETFKDKITKNLYEMHAQIKRQVVAPTISSDEISDDDDEEIQRIEQLLLEKVQKKQEKMKKKHFEEWLKTSDKDISISVEIDRQRTAIKEFCSMNGYISPESLFSESPKVSPELLQTIYAKKFPALPEKTPDKPRLSEPKIDMKRPMSLGECFARNTFIHHNKCDVYAEYDTTDGFIHLCEKDQSTGVIKRTIPSRTWQTLNRFTVRNYEEKMKRDGKLRTLCNNAYTECLFENDRGEWISCQVLYSGYVLTNQKSV